MAKLKFQIAKPDWLIIGLTLAFVIFGLLVIFDASTIIAQRDFGNKFYYLQNQIIWTVLGLASLIFFTFFDYHKLAKLSPIGLVIVVILLISVLIPQIGGEVLGAKRRLTLAGIVIQPSELVKLVYLVYLSFRFSKFSQRFFSFWQFIITTFVILALILAEPDLGTAIIIGSVAFLIYFLVGAPLKNFVVLSLIFLIAVFAAIFSADYRRDRFLNFINPGQDLQGISYHQNQILLGLGTGGLVGRGFGASLQKFYYLPEAPTDSIFAVIGEEFGFVGGTALVLGFLVLIWRGVKISNLAPDDLGRIMAAAIVFLIGLQVVINLSGQVALLPLTGIPLPFISYGGSSLVTLMAAIGILANVSRQRITTS